MILDNVINVDVVATLAWLGTAFTSGLVASGHCVTMCGGIAVGIDQTTQRHDWWSTLAPHVVRLSLYAIMGAALYLLYDYVLANPTTHLNLAFPPIPRWLPGIALISGAVVLYTSGNKRTCHSPCTSHSALRSLPGSLQRITLKPEQHLQNKIPVQYVPSVNTLDNNSTWSIEEKANSVATPFTSILRWGWGFLPCPMVIAMLLVSINTNSAALAAAFMLVFGLGSLPSLLGVTLLSRLIRGNSNAEPQDKSTKPTLSGTEQRFRLYRTLINKVSLGIINRNCQSLRKPRFTPAILCLCGLWTLSHDVLMSDHHPSDQGHHDAAIHRAMEH
jgi:sulfite exporter TauE/SafE